MHTLETHAARGDTGSVSSRTFPADRTAPRAATAWFRSLPTGLSPSRLGDAELCLDELVTNVVRYAYEDGGGHTLTVSVVRAGCACYTSGGRKMRTTNAATAKLARTEPMAEAESTIS